MAFRRLKFLDGDGIVQSNVEETMAVIGNIASEGMKKTDGTIIRNMIKQRHD
nr:hypothetical protein [Bacillota bacterium]